MSLKISWLKLLEHCWHTKFASEVFKLYCPCMPFGFPRCICVEVTRYYKTTMAVLTSKARFTGMALSSCLFVPFLSDFLFSFPSLHERSCHFSPEQACTNWKVWIEMTRPHIHPSHLYSIKRSGFAWACFGIFYCHPSWPHGLSQMSKCHHFLH